MQQLLFENTSSKQLWYHKEKCRYFIIDSEAKLSRMCDILRPCKLITLDIETNGLDVGTSSIIGVSLCPEVGLAFYIPLFHYGNSNIPIDMFVSYLSDILENTPILGHNLKFDYKFIMKKLGITLKCAHDTYIIAKLLDEFDSVGLKYLGELIFNFEVAELIPLLKQYNLKVDQGHMLKPTEMFEYACQDVDLTLRLFMYFWTEMNWRPDFIYDMEIDLIYSVAAMENRGVKINYKLLKELRIDYNNQIDDLGTNIRETLGVPHNFNLNSNEKLGKAIMSKFPNFKKHLVYTSKDQVVKLNDECVGKYITRFDDYLEENNEDKTLNFFRDFSKRKSMFSLVSKYINSWILRVETNKSTTIYTNFNALGTGTGRMSSNDPNMQNIAPEIRHAIIPRDGYYFLSMDYDQVEYRILAGMAGLDHLIEEMNKGDADVHKIAASMLFDIPMEDVSKDLRKQAKTLNFGLLYGMGIAKLSRALGISDERAEELSELYQARFLKGTTWFEDVKKFARKNGYVLTAYGRKRRIDNLNLPYDPYLSDVERKERSRLMGAAYRKATNTPIQGTSADITKLGLNSVHFYIQKEALDIHPVLVIHDDIVFEVNNKYKPEEIKPRLKGCLELMFKDKVKLTVDDNVSTVSWGAIKDG